VSVVHPQDLGLREQARLIAAGELDPGELLAATLARLAERDGPLRSTPEVFPRQARQMLAAAPGGPLRGVPVTVKDMYSLPWRGARNGTRHEVLPASASGLFGRVRDAGAIVGGLANQHELGLGSTGAVSAYGAHRNPWDPARSPGGSSGGSAAAVAARLVAGSVGSDTGGSARIPAAWCGCVGLKLSYGGVPRGGYTGAATSLSAWGPIARDAGDVRLLAEALLARRLPAGDGAALRVGIVPAPYWDDCDPEVAAACQAALTIAGWTVREVELPGAAHAVAAFMLRGFAELGTAIPAAVLADASPQVRALALYSRLWPAARLIRADRVRALLRRGLADAFADVYLLAWPTVPAPACPLDDPRVELPSGTVPADAANMRQVVLANLTGLPGISVPVRPHPSGLPAGLQLLGPWGGEARLLDAAEHLEHATGRAYVQAPWPIAAQPARPPATS
jgi:aspartyl-tRNA(Asn)/glutamyl-tRNA(Gln) amidotransferase subunit A